MGAQFAPICPAPYAGAAEAFFSALCQRRNSARGAPKKAAPLKTAFLRWEAGGLSGRLDKRPACKSTLDITRT